MFVFDDDAIIKHTHRLDQLHRAALPNAIRFTLNDAAFDVKKNTLQKHADDNFINRKPSFFKRFSGVEKATGFDIKKMSASVGMVIDSKVQATEDIEVQETGGTAKRDIIMLSGSRTTAANLGPNKSKMDKLVRKTYKGAGKPDSYYKAKGKKNFTRGAVRAATKNKPLKYTADNKMEYILDVSSVSKNIRNRKVKIKSKIIASNKNGRSVNISKKPFVQPAAVESAKQLNALFRKNAAKQIKKFS